MHVNETKADMDITEATLKDALAVAQIHAESWRRTYASELAPHYLEHVVPDEREKVWVSRLMAPKPDLYVVVAKINGEIVGFACAFMDGVNEYGAYLDNLHVALPHQGRGVGKMLLQSVAARCSDLNLRRGLCLLVNQSNVNAQQFYIRLGAKNIREDVWNAPDGSAIPTYWFTWSDVRTLARV